LDEHCVGDFSAITHPTYPYSRRQRHPGRPATGNPTPPDAYACSEFSCIFNSVGELATFYATEARPFSDKGLVSGRIYFLSGLFPDITAHVATAYPRILFAGVLQTPANESDHSVVHGFLLLSSENNYQLCEELKNLVLQVDYRNAPSVAKTSNEPSKALSTKKSD